ncbi:hypothetical protein EP7_005330 [Isosphaeraceae bacterium EP7]
MGPIEISQKRIEANRRNALLSTGPKTAEGKAKSRRNSLVHGLAGEGAVLPEDTMQAVRERAEQWNSSLRPANAFEMGLVETIAIESIRIDRCRVEEQLARDFRARQTNDCWADERKAEAARLARSLPARPDETASRLSVTAPGCEWLIGRWQALGHALDKTGAWTDEQRTMALDLLGVDLAARDMPMFLDVDDDATSLGARQALVDDQLERLHARKESSLDDIEDDRREAAAKGLFTVEDPALVLLRRYETASFRRMKWALDQMHKGNKTRPDDHGFGKRDFDPPAWKGPNPAAVPNFPAPRQMPSGPGAGAERTHSGAERSQFDPRGHFARAIEPAPQAEPPAQSPPENAPQAVRSQRPDRLARQRRQAAMAQLVAC